jgi:hypothetical protein
MNNSDSKSKRIKKHYASHAKRSTCIKTVIAAASSSSVGVPIRIRVRTLSFFLAPAPAEATTPEADADGVSAPALPACARTQPESLSGWSHKNHGSAG